MDINTIDNLIENPDAKSFINTIPSTIRQKCELIRVKPTQLIALKGNCITNIYISLQGKMQVKNEFENGFVYSFAAVESIAYIGAMEVMAHQHMYSSTLQTTIECIMLKLSKEDFIQWITTDHRLALKVLAFVSSNMYAQSLNAGEVLAYPAIYSLITYLINAYQSEGNDVVYLTKTREEIGWILGFSIRTINRNLKKLKDEELITVNRKNLSINKEQFDRLLDKLQSIK